MVKPLTTEVVSAGSTLVIVCGSGVRGAGNAVIVRLDIPVSRMECVMMEDLVHPLRVVDHTTLVWDVMGPGRCCRVMDRVATSVSEGVELTSWA